MAKKRTSKSPLFILLIACVLIVILAVMYLAVSSVGTSQDIRSKAFSIIPRPEIKPKSRPLYAIGDSITFGHKDCSPSCQLETETYLYKFAAANYVIGTSYTNLASSGTTATCLTNCFSPQINQNPAAFKNTYKNPKATLPANQSVTQNDMIVNNMSGELRANLGEFDKIQKSDVIIAYGRNDTNATTISLSKFHGGLGTILNHLDQSNKLLFLTIPPQSETFWRNKNWSQTLSPQTKLGRDLDILKADVYDSFFSAAIWKIAATRNASVIPVHEYLVFNPTSDYISNDGIHPSKAGHDLIARLIKQFNSPVRTQRITTADEFNLITSQNDIYGQIVTEDNSGLILYAEAFEVHPDKPYLFKKMAGNMTIYSTDFVNLSKPKLDTRTQVLIRKEIESVTAYGRGWNWYPDNSPWMGRNGFDLTTVKRFAEGPCKGKTPGTCTMDTRAMFIFNGEPIESITAYGKGWNFKQDGGAPWGSTNGFDLTTVKRFAEGPCRGRAPDTCTFDSRAHVIVNGESVESITAYGKGWNYKFNGDPWFGIGFDLTDVKRYKDGPCNGKKPNTCIFDTRTMIKRDGKIFESVTAYGSTWNW